MAIASIAHGLPIDCASSYRFCSDAAAIFATVFAMVYDFLLFLVCYRNIDMDLSTWILLQAVMSE